MHQDEFDFDVAVVGGGPAGLTAALYTTRLGLDTVDGDGETSVPGVYAVGDLTPGHNQIPVAMGEGADAGIAIHMDLRAFPRSIEDVEAGGPVGGDEVPALSEELLATAVAHEGHAGSPRTGDAAAVGDGGTTADD